MLSINILRRLLVLFLIFMWPISGYGLSFMLPKAGDSVVGEIKTAQVRHEEDFSDVAARFDVGYYDIFEANPGIDYDNPPLNATLIIPTQCILPTELKENTIVVNLVEMRLYYLPKKGGKVYIFPVGIGKEDWETPLGERTVIRKVKDPIWVAPDSIYKFRKDSGDKIERVTPPGPDNPMGKYALFLSGEGSLRNHGTNVPAGIGRRTSAGCIRLYADDIKQLYHLVNVGTKVNIINQPYKAGWLGNKLYLEAHRPLFEQRLEMGNDIRAALDAVSNAVRGHNIVVDWDKVKNIAKEQLTVPRAIN